MITTRATETILPHVALASSLGPGGFVPDRVGGLGQRRV
jgi:hypothetical protein